MQTNAQDRMVRETQNRVISLGAEMQRRMGEKRAALQVVERKAVALRDQMLSSKPAQYEQATTEFVALRGRRDLLLAELEEMGRRYEKSYLVDLRERCEEAEAEARQFQQEKVNAVHQRYYGELGLKVAEEQARANLILSMPWEQRMQLRRELIEVQADKARAKLELEDLSRTYKELCNQVEALREELKTAERSIKEIREEAGAVEASEPLTQALLVEV